MDEKKERSLNERVELLEKAVEELRCLLGQLILREKGLKAEIEPEEAVPVTEKPLPEPPLAPSLEPEPPRRAVKEEYVPSPLEASRQAILDEYVSSRPETPPVSERVWNYETWFNRIGIGLLLFGLVFLFKYSIDRGWLTPAVRVGFGLALGAGLLFTGLRLKAERRHFAQFLLGGAIATFYITGFAAFQLYDLVPYLSAFAFMVAVTILAFSISLRQNEPVLSLIGAIGGLATPFLLYTSKGSLPGLVGYTCLILAGTSVIYLLRGWRSLLWVSVIGGWAVFIIGYSKGLPSVPGAAPLSDLWSLQSGILFGWIAFWALPVMREALQVMDSKRWISSLPGFQNPALNELGQLIQRSTAHVLTVSMPLAVLLFSRLIWTLSDATWGWITMGGIFLYGLVSWRLSRWEGLKNLAYTHALMALTLLTIALFLLLEGNVLFFVLAVEAGLLHLVSHRLSDRGTAISAHILFVMLVYWLAIRQISSFGELTGNAGKEIIYGQALANFAVIVIALGISKVLKSPVAVELYRLIPLLFLTGEFYLLFEGNVLILVFTAEAVALHLVSWWLNNRSLAIYGHILFGLIALLLALRLTANLQFIFAPKGMAILNWQAATDLAIIAAGLGLSMMFRSKEAAQSYRLAAHLAVLGWFLRELSALPNGQAYVTSVWGIYAVALLVLGLRINSSDLRNVAVGTLFLVVGKLFLVDLAKLEAIWRVLLFLGFGGLFLVLSYYFQSLWKKGTEPPKSE